jgi:hypothetical protein
METIRATITESESELRAILDRTLADPMANDPEKKSAMVLWAFKATEPGSGKYTYPSVAKVIEAVKAAKWLNGSIAFGSEGTRIFDRGVSPISINQWLDDYRQSGLEESLTIRRSGSRKPHPSNGYTIEEIDAEINKPANKAVKGQLILLKTLVENDFRLSANEITSVEGVPSYTAGVRTFKIAFEYYEANATIEKLSNRLLQIHQQQQKTKDLDADQVAYQFRVPELVRVAIKATAERQGLKLAAFFRECADSYLKMPEPKRIKSDIDVDQWIGQMSDGDDMVLGGTVRLKNKPANELEKIRGERTDTELMQHVIGAYLMAIDTASKAA